MSSSDTTRSFVAQHAAALNTLAYFLSGNSMMSILAVQGVVVRFLARYDQLTNEEDMLTELFRTTIRESITPERSVPDARMIEEIQVPERTFFQQIRDHKTSDLRFEVAVEKEVRKALFTLKPDLRIPIILRDLFHFTYDRIARILDVPQTTLSYRISLARKQVIDALRNEPAIS